ncbi:HD-GYP domain-containing protein [Chloroflexota bacterium]
MNWRGRAMQISTKLIVAFLLASLVPLAVIGALFYFNDKEDLTQQVLSHLESVAAIQRNGVENIVDQNLERLGDYAVDLVLLDIRMPGKLGTELLPKIKAAYPDTAVIMATAIADTQTAIRCMQVGAYDYVTKPFNLDEVILSVDRALEKRRLELENRDYQRHLEHKVDIQARKIRTSFLGMVMALAHALEAKDSCTGGHSQRVAQIATAIAEKLGMPRHSIEKVRVAGLIHDIGKIGVRESVLSKPGRLTAEEFQHTKDHCEMGEYILVPIVNDREILGMVRNHHERYNGSGYPDGLSGEQIPLGARILAVADAFLRARESLVAVACQRYD